MIADVIKIKLDELLAAAGETDGKGNKKPKPLFAVARETGISYNTLHNIKKGKISAISFDVLEKLCKHFHCTPNDLLVVEDH